MADRDKGSRTHLYDPPFNIPINPLDTGMSTLKLFTVMLSQMFTVICCNITENQWALKLKKVQDIKLYSMDTTESFCVVGPVWLAISLPYYGNSSALLKELLRAAWPHMVTTNPINAWVWRWVVTTVLWAAGYTGARGPVSHCLQF